MFIYFVCFHFIIITLILLIKMDLGQYEHYQRQNEILCDMLAHEHHR